MADKNIPEIRFDGFSEEWNEQELQNQVDFFTGLTYSPNDINKNGTFVIRSSNVKNGSILKEDNVFVNSDVVNCDNVQKNDIIVVVRNGSRDLIGKHAQIKKDEHNTVIGAFMTGIRANNPNYVTALLDTNKFKKEIDKNLGATINQITTGNFRKMNFYFPVKKEQTKIGSFFENIDQLLNQHQTQHKKLKALKKAMLSKLFPKQGETVPEIRFKGFSGEWKKKTFESIFTYHRPDKYIVKSDQYNSKYSTPVLTANKSFILGYTDEKNVFNDKSVIIDDFTLDLKYVDFPFMVKSSALKILTIKDENDFDLIFSYNLLKTTKFEIKGHARHYINVVQKTEIFTPSILEQQKIGSYFENLDSLIENHEKQIEKLSVLKKACLSKMFV